VDIVFKALGDAVRLAIVDELVARDGQTLFELVVRLIELHGFALSRQAVSKHLAILQNAGIVTVDRVGRTSVHRLNGAALASIRDWVNERES